MGNDELNAQDLLLFVKILQTQWPNRADNLRPGFKDIWHAIRMKNRKVFMKNVAVVKSWMGVQLATPRLWQDDKNLSIGKTLSSPPMLAIVTTLISKFNITRHEAWNMRLGEARWYDTCKAEMGGLGVKVAYDNEEEFVSELKGKSESEIVAIAKKHMSKGSFVDWQIARRKNKK